MSRQMIPTEQRKAALLVIGAGGYVGIVWSCGPRGFLALDSNSKALGLYETTDAAAAAVLECATVQACQSCAD